MSHELSVLDEVVEVSSCVDYSYDIMELGCLVALCFDRVQQVLEVCVGDRELVKQSVQLEQLDTEVQKCGISQGLLVLENVEVPLVEVVHHLD